MTSERKLLTPAGPVKKIPGVHFSFVFVFFHNFLGSSPGKHGGYWGGLGMQ